jgi:hypothetical protein
MTCQERGHRGMLSISMAVVDRSPYIEVHATVDEDSNRVTDETLSEPHCTEGTSKRERCAPQLGQAPAALPSKPPHQTSMYSWDHDASAASSASMRPRINAPFNQCVHELVPNLINVSMN